jgi:hypothetical protein
MMTSRILLPAAALFVATLGTVGVAGQRAPHAHDAQSSPPAANAQALPAPPGPLPALPDIGYEPPMPMLLVRQVYEFAARHPEVLQYVPCYCGCERVGHTGNHSCFVKSRAANGRITEWDLHGIGCAICLDIGRKAMTMFNAGMSVTAIRAKIEKDYGTRYRSHTPTPQPPAIRRG